MLVFLMDRRKIIANSVTLPALLVASDRKMFPPPKLDILCFGERSMNSR